MRIVSGNLNAVAFRKSILIQSLKRLAFNQAGHANAKRLINEAKTKRADDKLMPGMLVVCEDMHVDIMHESAEAQALIAAYK